jgi:Uma2 family endonuclease
MSVTLRRDDVYVTPEEYLLAERVSETKHEYLAGVVYAMAGASRAHNVLATNLLAQLHNQLRGKSGQPFGSDMRLRIRKPGASFYYYPDVAVDCSGSKEDEIDQPTVIFEVLSPETERGDRGDKLVNYQSLPSMRVYALVDQFRMAVTVYRRGDGDAWAREFYSDVDAKVDLGEIGCALNLRAIYERVLEA